MAILSASALAQQSSSSSAPIGRTSAKEVNVSGAVEVHNGEMLLGNGSAITAGTQDVTIALTRGGQLKLCSTTAVHLSHDQSIDAQNSTALMMALDRGAIEANYETGKYSDVLLTPDLRILISGPGHADLKIRVNIKGDTCIDNHGANAPYITISSQIDGGLYRIHPDQHITLEHGSLRDIVDTETEPCGCPPPVSIADAGTSSAHPAAPGQAVGGPSSTPSDTAFPLAESEGLAPPPGLPTTPVAKPGEVHAQVTVPLSYSGDAPAGNPTAPAANPMSAPPKSTPAPSQSAPDQAPSTTSVTPSVQAAAPVSKPPESPGFFHKIGRFFSRVFGNG